MNYLFNIRDPAPLSGSILTKTTNPSPDQAPPPTPHHAVQYQGRDPDPLSKLRGCCRLKPTRGRPVQSVVGGPRDESA